MRTLFIHSDSKCLIAALALVLIYFICKRAELATMVKCSKLGVIFCIISTSAFSFNMLFYHRERWNVVWQPDRLSFIRCLILFTPVSVEILLFTLGQKEKGSNAYIFELNAHKVEILHIYFRNCVYLIISLIPRIYVHCTVHVS